MSDLKLAHLKNARAQMIDCCPPILAGGSLLLGISSPQLKLDCLSAYFVTHCEQYGESFDDFKRNLADSSLSNRHIQYIITSTADDVDRMAEVVPYLHDFLVVFFPSAEVSVMKARTIARSASEIMWHNFVNHVRVGHEFAVGSLIWGKHDSGCLRTGTSLLSFELGWLY
ncbi:hypothetical protein FOL47_010763 [Perkinsus chesapeaki]|uniref:Uncharacterized protein n=1 Tax=Perkinsus chesapeaki TaxID=330153 RepID=A0A7J6L0N3_PERCH|nr:hypothetical protein FOL47_010763 [Perkinsus chesapeaki]